MHAAHPKVSVVMASYNHEAFVREAIESVLNQSYHDFELVITDDGSADGTVDVIRRVCDSRIRLNAFASNQGACIAINDAITRARGDYIAVLNSDDYFLPGKLEAQVGFLDARSDIGAVFGLPLFVNQQGKPFHNPVHAFANLFTDQNRTNQDWLRHFFYHGNTLCHPTILIRRACYEKIGLFDPLLMQLPDLDMWVRLCRAYAIHVMPEKLTAFRILDQERNTSAPSKERLARSAWETFTVLTHYAALSEDELRAVFQFDSNQDELRRPKIKLALEAIRVGKPGYAPFGLDLLRKCMRENGQAFSPPEYFRLVGEMDPFSAELFARDHQFIKKLGVLSVARRLVRWCRLFNLHG